MIGTLALISQFAILSLWVVLPTYADSWTVIPGQNGRGVASWAVNLWGTSSSSTSGSTVPDTSSTDMGLLQGISRDKLRNGDISFSDIPLAIQGATNFLLSIVGSISVVMIIVWAFRMAVGSISNDKSKGKDAITYGVYGLIVATSGWFILKLVIEGLF